MRVFHSETHLLHQPAGELHGGRIVAPFETGERITRMLDALRAFEGVTLAEPERFGLGPVLDVHDADYVDFLQTCWRDWKALGHEGDAIAICWPTRTMTSTRVPESIQGKLGFYALGTDTMITEGTFAAAEGSSDIALSATKDVLSGTRFAVGLCRPPGHHAAHDQFGGYCFFNNAAIAAEYARKNAASRIAIFDVDFHHGNGTQSIFYDRDDVLFVSIHGEPQNAFPFFLGYADETGSGRGEGFNLNLPLPRGTTAAQWMQAFDTAAARIADFAPDLLIVSLGVDTHEDDPISFFRFGTKDFTLLGERLGALGLPVVTLLEGGYHLSTVGANIANVLRGLMSTQALRPQLSEAL